MKLATYDPYTVDVLDWFFVRSSI